jgi:D-methionine transport system ATP-binding protein
VAIARVLANEPDILLCDEATSALDPETTKTILTLLKNIHDTLGITIVIITHEMRVIQEICTQVAVLDNGTVQECGAVADIFCNPKTAAARRLLLISRET